MFYDEIDEQEQRPLSKRACVVILVIAVVILTGYGAAIAMHDPEQQCVEAGGDPWHCAEQYGQH